MKKAFEIMMFFLLILAICIMGWFAIREAKKEATRPCEQYGSTELRFIPARCARFFYITESPIIPNL
jgi:hypothetical protein